MVTLLFCEYIMEFEEGYVIRKQNLIIFSATKSEEKCQTVRSYFKNTDNECHHWKDLFENAYNKEDMILLTMLIKKIPTF